MVLVRETDGLVLVGQDRVRGEPKFDGAAEFEGRVRFHGDCVNQGIIDTWLERLAYIR